MQLRTRKLTVSETIFLAATLTAASLTTIEVIPKSIKSIEKQSAIVQAEIKKKKLIHPIDAFSTGLIVGLGIGTFATVKMIAAKINAHP
ncbi:MAG: hypothetical protein WCD53_01770 [Microcoleus sp.]